MSIISKEEAHNKLNSILKDMMDFCDDMNYDFSRRDILECMEVLTPYTITDAVSKIHIK